MAKSKSKSQKRKQIAKKHTRRLAQRLVTSQDIKSKPSQSMTATSEASHRMLATQKSRIVLKSPSAQNRLSRLRVIFYSLRSPGAFKYTRISATALTMLAIFMSIGLLFEIHNLDLAIALSKKPVLTTRLTRSFDNLKNLKQATASLKAEEDNYKINVADTNTLWSKIDAIAIELATGNGQAAYKNMKAYSQELKSLRNQLSLEVKKQDQEKIMLAKSTPQAVTIPGEVFVPILIYHYTPPDFDAQLASLSAKGYTTITMDNLSDHMRFGRPLPPKPVVITFDDGFKNQLNAFEILKRHNMKATYYIITSGEASRWCIGVGRKYDQNPSCGDDYMNWDDISQLDHSGLIEIAAHTVDHLALPNESLQVQQFQISESKKVLEQKLGHPIYHIAYPYGSYNATTVNLVESAGFLTAVTTMPGSQHDLGSILTLSRERDAFKLP